LIGGIDEALLVSAYDIDNHLLSDDDSFRTGFAHSQYADPQVLFIDNGWYERDGPPPASSFVKVFSPPQPWSQDQYFALLDSLDTDIKAVAVSWDNEDSTYTEQIELAQETMASRARYASAILLKRPKGVSYHDLNRMTGSDISNMRRFDIIGVTEKELGETILDRLHTLATFRERLDENDITAPIHIFGGLDPLETPLYFSAGAEIFDGLGWLRYAYRNGIAIRQETNAMMDLKVIVVPENWTGRYVKVGR
jgi:hypothetical protein